MVKKSMGLAVALGLLFFGFTSYSLAEEKGLVGFWKLDEGKGDIVKDSSGKGNDGEIKGPIWTKDGLQFNGEGKDVNIFIPASESLNITEQITIEAWVKPAMSNDDYNTVVTTQKGAWFFGTRQKNAVSFLVDFSSKKWNVVCISKPCLKPDVFNHIVGTYNSETGTVKVYANGECVGSCTGDDVPAPSPGWFLIGDKGTRGTYSFHGIIKEVKIYNRVLSAEEIKEQSK